MQAHRLPQQGARPNTQDGINRGAGKLTPSTMASITELLASPRVFVRRGGEPDPKGTCVVYWMQRSQRVLDNPALDVAVEAANLLHKPVVIFFAPVPFYPRANRRHYVFLQQGIDDIARHASERRVGFVLQSYPDHSLLSFCEKVRPALVVGDENPMREPEQWRQKVAKRLKVPFWTVDSDVIVPSRLLTKEHYSARTIRPRILELLEGFLLPPANLNAGFPWTPPVGLRSLDPSRVMEGWRMDETASPVSTFRGGTTEALARLRSFVEEKLTRYPLERNRPELPGTSALSPYLHFGHIGPLTVALAVRAAPAPEVAKNAFLEQLVVRRELSINFVRFNPEYDSITSAPAWAHRTLGQHAIDERPRLYTASQMENAETHDPLWNAAHKQMVFTGWMHNYLRMYWAKKILEWSPSPAVAFQRAVEWNDRYELDGRDPNGYAGISWAIAGKHDRPWFERPIFGQVRYMSFGSTSKKFDSKRYIAQIEALEKGSAATFDQVPLWPE